MLNFLLHLDEREKERKRERKRGRERERVATGGKNCNATSGEEGNCPPPHISNTDHLSESCGFMEPKPLAIHVMRASMNVVEQTANAIRKFQSTLGNMNKLELKSYSLLILRMYYGFSAFLASLSLTVLSLNDVRQAQVGFAEA